VPKLSIGFEDIISLAHGKFEEQNKVLETYIIIIKYCIIIIIIIIIAYYNYIL